ncbi:hypothetical protein ZWY2020_038566 [Hordeum vulgare]|nr:hypothetical protein ZWY2020_038566 [Hordeum vulgare]
MVRHTRSRSEALTPQRDEPSNAYELHEETNHSVDREVDSEEDSDDVGEELPHGEGYSDDVAEEEVQDVQHVGEELDGAEEEGDLNGTKADLENHLRKHRSRISTIRRLIPAEAIEAPPSTKI